MNTSLGVPQSVITPATASTPGQTGNLAAAKKAAQDFEGVFISQMLSYMFSGISVDEEFGGGQGEEMFRSLIIDEYGKQISARGGIGLAKNVLKELIAAQERKS